MAEFLAAIGAALESVTQVNKYVITPILNQFSYLFNYNKNIQSLSDQVEELNQKRNNLKLEIDAATDNTEEIGGDVTRWLEKVTEINTKKDQVIQDKAQVQQGCCYGKCPNLKLRYSLSKEAKKVNEIARKLVEESGNFKKISYRVRPDPIPITSVGIEVDSRKFKEDEIMNALKDENIYVISICGMGGVGKTTMVKKIEKRVRENLQGKLFDEVAFVVVSRPLDLKKIQLGIAEELGLPLREETIPARARRLHKRLTDIKSVLIILDDVWEKFNFQEVGIPSKSIHSGCKIIITSRIQSICKKFEDPVRVIYLDILSETEAWNLFKEKAGGDEVLNNDPQVYPIAMDVAKECKGLPLALVTVAAALKNLSIYSWKSAFHQLRGSSAAMDIEGVVDEVFVPLKLSFDYLQSEEARYLFLLCCLFPEDYDIPIETLVIYAFGLHKFVGIENLVDARNRVYSLVEMLKDRFLLIGSTLGSEDECTQYDCVKMHDTIRDMAIFVASKGKDKHGFMVVHDSNLKEWPKRDSYENITCISLASYSYDKIILPENINCPRLELLYLSLLRGGVEIKDNTFRGITGLKVLITDGVQSFPSSSLPVLATKLHSLFLESTEILELPNEIGELVNLEILSLANSNIRKLQKEIGRLTNLKLLNLTSCFQLSNIAPGVLSRLVQLEVLLMLQSFQQWEADGTERNNASIAEVASLTKLTNLQIRVRENRINLLEDTRNWHKLIRYNVHIGTWSRDYNSDIRIKRSCIIDLESEVLITQRSIALYLVERVDLSHSLRVMLENAEVIQLLGEGSGDIVNKLSRNCGFQNVKILCLKCCENLEFLYDSSAQSQLNNTAFLPRLTQLQLYFIHRLFKEVCRGQPPVGSFSSLTMIKVQNCNGLKNLFSFSIAATLSNLKMLHILECYAMETLFFQQNQNGISQIAFPKLYEIKLWDLPSLSAFCKATHDHTTLEQPKEKFLFDHKVMCSRLKALQVIDMNFQIQIFDPKIPIGGLFGLNSLDFRRCNRSINLFSSSICRGITNLQTLRVNDCPMLQEVISPKDKLEKEEEETNSSQALTLLFPQLETLLLYSLPKILQFCHFNHTVELPLLEVLDIWHCPLMESFSRAHANYGNSAALQIEGVVPMTSSVQSFFDGVTFGRIRNLLLLNVNGPKRLFNHVIIGNLSELEELGIIQCSILEEVFSVEDETNSRTRVEILFPKLRKLELEKLPRLCRFWHIKNDVKLPSLEDISIKNCPMLESFSLGSTYVPNKAHIILSENLASEYFIREQAKQEK